MSQTSGQRRKTTIKVWELLMMWKYGSTLWEKLKNMKKCDPVQLEYYYIMINIISELDFEWPINNVIKKRYRTIVSTK